MRGRVVYRYIAEVQNSYTTAGVSRRPKGLAQETQGGLALRYIQFLLSSLPKISKDAKYCPKGPSHRPHCAFAVYLHSSSLDCPLEPTLAVFALVWASLPLRPPLLAGLQLHLPRPLPHS